MQRMIKFRIWNEEVNKMIFKSPFKSGENYDSYYSLNDNKNIMQFTGLKDKNGVEIYEGDILNCVHCHDENVDYWKDGKAITVVEWIEKDAFYQRPYDLNNWEVISNIYENPELLQQIT